MKQKSIMLYELLLFILKEFFCKSGTISTNLPYLYVFPIIQ